MPGSEHELKVIKVKGMKEIFQTKPLHIIGRYYEKLFTKK